MGCEIWHIKLEEQVGVLVLDFNGWLDILLLGASLVQEDKPWGASHSDRETLDIHGGLN